MRHRIIRYSFKIASASSLSLAALLALASRAEAQQLPPAKAIPVPPVTVVTPDKDKPVQSAAPKKSVTPKPTTQQAEPASQPKPPKPKPVAASTPPQTSPPEVGATLQQQADPATALGSYNPALDVDGLNVPPGMTLTTAGPVAGYRALSAMSASKTATTIERLPQSIQVLPKSLLQDQSSLTVTEATQNVSNVQASNELTIANTELTPAKIRGFGAEQWLDGLGVTYNAGDRDSFANIERIEVLKGPNAILYGGGAGAPVGGAINVVSKLPVGKAGGEFGVTVGSHAYVRPYFDINQPLNTSGTALLRVTGEYKAADSFIDVLESESYAFNPTLTLTNKTDTTLTVQGRISRQSQQAYQGLPVTGTLVGDFRIRRDLFIGPSDIPPSYSEVQGVTASLDHRFNSFLSGHVKARWSKSEFDQLSQFAWNADFTGATPLFAPSTWGLMNIELFQEQQEFTINPSLQAKFDYGGSQNILLVGGDYTRVTDRGFMAGDMLGANCYFFGGPCLPTLVDLTDPSFTTPFTRPSPLTSGLEYAPFFDFENIYVTKGLYTQLQSTLYDKVHVMGGVRLANIDIEYIEKATGAPTKYTTDATKLLPRAGIVVDVVDGLSLYASYSEGLRWVGFSTAVTEPKPEESEQFEAGFKFNLGNQLTGTVAYFDIIKHNVPVRTSLGTATLSDQKSTGFEADILWQASKNWRMLASYGYTDVTFGTDFRDPTTFVTVKAGSKVPYVPEQSGRVWVNYAFDQPMLRGWSVGAGIYVSSGQTVDNLSLYKTASYFTVDAKVAYETEKFRATFNVKNLTGEEYFVPYAWLGGQVAPGTDRAYYGTFVYKY